MLLNGGVTVRDSRRANRSHVLRHLYEHGPSSRREVAAACGLAVSTLTPLIEEMMACRLVVELEPVRRPCAGRPTRPIMIGGDDHCVLGLHLGDYAVTAVVTTLGGGELWSTTQPAPSGTSPETWVGQIRDLLRQLARICPNRGLLAVQVATAVSEDPGAPSAFLEPVLDVFTGGGIPVDVAEDLQMAGLQARRGELQLSADDVGVYLGGSRTVGCSIIVGDRFLGGTAGMGHTRVTAQGQPAWCDCGRSGCLTGVAGLTALLVRGGLLGQAAARRSVRDDPMAAADAVYAQAASGNPRMIATLNVAALAMAAVIDAVTGATGASTVAIGGYLGLLHPFLGSSLDGRSGVPITALPSSEPLRIVRGAALTARLSVLTDPSLLTRRRTV